MKKYFRFLCLTVALVLTSTTFLACSGSSQKIDDPLEWNQAIINTLQATNAYKISNLDGDNSLAQTNYSFYEWDDNSRRVLNYDRNVTVTVTEKRVMNADDTKSNSSATTKYYFKGDKAKLGADYYAKIDGAYRTIYLSEEGNYTYNSKHCFYSNGEYEEFNLGTADYTLDGNAYSGMYLFQENFLGLFIGVLEYEWDSLDGSNSKKVSFVKPEHFYLDYKKGKYVYNTDKARELEKHSARETKYRNDENGYNLWLENKEKEWATFEKNILSLVFKNNRIEEMIYGYKYKDGKEYCCTILYEYGKTEDIVLPPSDKIIDTYESPFDA